MKSQTRMGRVAIVLIALACVFSISSKSGAQATPRPMNFMDVMEMRTVASPDLSPDGKWLLYTLSVPDWKAGRAFTDVWLASTDGSSNREMTFTHDKNETNPKWSHDGRFFVFASDRDAPPAAAGAATSGAAPAGGGEGAPRSRNQLYLMRPDGGEAARITDVRDRVGTFAFSKDGKWLAFSAGRAQEQQIWIFSTAELELGKAKQLTKHSTPITSWQFSPDSRRIYFLSPDSVDKADRERLDKRFTVRIRDQQSPAVHLWALDLDSRKESRLTSGTDYTVSSVTLSKNSQWIGFRGGSMNRYEKGTDAPDYADLYLLNVESGKIERLTNNRDISESPLSFSPDSSWIAFSASDDFKYFYNDRIYVRPVAGGEWKKLGSNFDGDVRMGFWSKDGHTIYSTVGTGATTQIFAVDVATGTAGPVTHVQGAVRAMREDDPEEDSEVVLLSYSDPISPNNLYVTRIETLADQNAWKRVTDSNPQVTAIQLGKTEAVRWKSSDGAMVEGVLVYPLNYEKGKRYPLIVQIHGGPAGADTLGFNGRYVNYSHVYAAGGYFCLMPNYRGSTNYGQKFKMQISGDYYRQAFDDIMTGVDNLIKLGLVDENKMGVMGWSAGGHWSNWTLTHTNRFKAISSGAGTMNWISMYAETDTQLNREFYFKGKPYDNFEHYWNESPLKYIKNAKTPTLIHVVEGDPRVPRPQSEELHMALEKLGVPTEFMVYPGSTHGIPDMRNQMVKMVSEYGWFEKWINGKQAWFDWKSLNDTIKDDTRRPERTSEERPADPN
ncbi:MAG: prolyl oligopeptidase family serine peptidase [Acidobacteriia bacterium]|nr:prolyl oligopeptidase family serine peptidase [Terriglobia bacterium]